MKTKPKKLTVAEIAKRIRAHLKRFEADKEINKKDEYGYRPYYCPSSYDAGRFVKVRYAATYQAEMSLTRGEALAYLEWLDAGNVGTHDQAVDAFRDAKDASERKAIEAKPAKYLYDICWKDDDSGYQVRRMKIIKERPRRMTVQWELADGGWDFEREYDTRYKTLHETPEAAIEAERSRLQREIDLHEQRLSQHRASLEKIEQLASEVLK